MGCEFCPGGGGFCGVCALLGTPPGEFPDLGDGSLVAHETDRRTVGIMPDDPPFTASVLAPDCNRLWGRPVPVTIWVSWEWWGVEVAGPWADCLEFLTAREVPASARPAFSSRLRR